MAITGAGYALLFILYAGIIRVPHQTGGTCRHARCRPAGYTTAGGSAAPTLRHHTPFALLRSWAAVRRARLARSDTHGQATHPPSRDADRNHPAWRFGCSDRRGRAGARPAHDNHWRTGDRGA